MNGLFSISSMGYIILPIDEVHHFSRWLKRSTKQLSFGRVCQNRGPGGPHISRSLNSLLLKMAIEIVDLPIKKW